MGGARKIKKYIQQIFGWLLGQKVNSGVGKRFILNKPTRISAAVLLDQVSTKRVCECRRRVVMLSTPLGWSRTLALLLPNHSSQRDESGRRPRLLVSPSSNPAVSVGCFQPDLLRLSSSERPTRKPPEQMVLHDHRECRR